MHAPGDNQKKLIRRSQAIETLLQVSHTVSRIRDPDQVVSHAMQALERLLKVPYCMVHLMQEGTDRVVVHPASPWPGGRESFERAGVRWADLVLAQRAFKTKRAVHIADYQDLFPRLPPRVKQAVGKMQLLSLVLAPMFAGERCLGTVALGTTPDYPRPFSSEDILLAETIANQLGIALDNAHLYQQMERAIEQRTAELQAANRELRQANRSIAHLNESLKQSNADLSDRNARLGTINEIGQAIIQEYLHGLHPLLARIIEQVTVAFDLHSSLLYLYDEDRSILRLEYLHSVAPPNIPTHLRRRIECLRVGPRVRTVTGRAAYTRRPVTADDLMSLPLARAAQESIRQNGLLGVQCEPLLVGDRLIGVYTVVSRRREVLRPEDIQPFQTVCYELAIAIDAYRQRQELLHKNLELARKNQKLLELDRLKFEVLSLVSHEFQTPLTSIKGYTETMLFPEEMVISPEKRREYLRIIDNQVDRLSRMVDNMLLVARVEVDKLQLSLQWVDLGEVIGDVLREMAPQLSERAVSVTLPAQPTTLIADPDRLHEILLNLIDNAKNYSDSTAPISIQVTRRPLEFRITVSDRGIGIAQADRTRLFQKFSRLSNSDRHPIQGSGLGLYIAKTLVEAHGGRIGMEPRPGGGTRFYFTLSILDKPDETGAHGESQNTGRRRRSGYRQLAER